jgi:predicted RNA binding protein YcfA (HicA-like mRNA interferase family)
VPRISPIPSRGLRRLFEKAGFKCVRAEGDHYVYTKKGVTRPIVIPDWPEVPVFVIKKICPQQGSAERSISSFWRKYNRTGPTKINQTDPID